MLGTRANPPRVDALPFEFDKRLVNKFPFQPYLPSGNQ
jgi:hypothetical protein